MKKGIYTILLGCCCLAVLAWANAVRAENGQDCAARGGYCDKACLSKPSIGVYDCPISWQCCGDPAQATRDIFGTGSGTGNVTGKKSISFDSPLGQNMGTVDKVLTSLSGYLNSVAAVVALIFILIGASFYVIAGFGKSSMAELGKKMMVVAIGGFVVVVAAPVIWQEIRLIIQGDPANVVQTSQMVRIVNGALRGFLGLVGFYAILSFLIGGIAYFIAWGDEKRMDRAKTILRFALIGTVIAIGALVLAAQIVRLLMVS